MNSNGTEKKGKKVSINSKNLLDIQPIVYSFKVPPNSNPSGSVVTAPRPPQWLYHDHVLGVIWMIFHKEKNYVGISQLQWCLNFLMDLKNSEGEYTEDVEICIQAIQDNLIEQYAKLGPALEKTIEEKSNEKTKDKNFRNESVPEDNDDSKQAPNTNLTEPTSSNDNNNNNNNIEEGEEKDLTIPRIQEIIGTSTPQSQQSKTSNHETKQIVKKSEKHCGVKCATFDPNKKKEEMLSFTYNEMLSRGPAPCTKSDLIEDAYSNEKSLEYILSDQGNLANLNLSDLVNYLNSSRQEHIARINKEMETLRKLEEFLENLNISGLSAQNIENLKKSLDNLQQQNFNEETEEIHNINE